MQYQKRLLISIEFCHQQKILNSDSCNIISTDLLLSQIKYQLKYFNFDTKDQLKSAFGWIGNVCKRSLKIIIIIIIVDSSKAHIPSCRMLMALFGLT